MVYLLLYEVVDDYVQKRAPFRQSHLALASRLVERGDLLLGGAFEEPVDRAVILFRSQEAAEFFVQRDPYVQNGLVTKWAIRRWNTVAGSLLDQCDEQSFQQ